MLVGNAQASRNVDPSSALCGRWLKALRGGSGGAGRKPLLTLAKDRYRSKDKGRSPRVSVAGLF